MNRVMKFDDWNSKEDIQSKAAAAIEESAKILAEADGISHAVYGHLRDCFNEKGEDCSFEEASEYVSSKLNGWKLSKGDFEEFKKTNESFSSEDRLDEGKMKEIAAISQEADSKEDFEEKLKAYLKETGKPELAEDKDFIEAMTADWKPSTKG